MALERTISLFSERYGLTSPVAGWAALLLYTHSGHLGIDLPRSELKKGFINASFSGSLPSDRADLPAALVLRRWHLVATDWRTREQDLAQALDVLRMLGQASNPRERDSVALSALKAAIQHFAGGQTITGVQTFLEQWQRAGSADEDFGVIPAFEALNQYLEKVCEEPWDGFLGPVFTEGGCAKVALDVIAAYLHYQVRSELQEIRAETGEMFLARGTQFGRYQESLRLVSRYVTGRNVFNEALFNALVQGISFAENNVTTAALRGSVNIRHNSTLEAKVTLRSFQQAWQALVRSIYSDASAAADVLGVAVRPRGSAARHHEGTVWKRRLAGFSERSCSPRKRW